MFISELEKKTGLPRHTIRFYEQEGLLEKRSIRRGENNYRDYSENAAQRLLNIKAVQAAGFTLAELKELVAVYDSGELTTQKQAGFLRQKSNEIGRKIVELERIQTYLTSKLALMYAEENGSAHHEKLHNS
jgi:DNA-binding transcriptional MerR regulator